jgi:macrolide-specific efflux system membrane fusion protein
MRARFSRRVLAGLGITALLVAIVLAAKVRGGGAPSAPASAVPVELADLEQRIEAPGSVQPGLKVDVGAQVSGIVQAVEVKLGQAVHRGDVLVRLDPALAQNEVLQARAALAQQQATVEARRIDLEEARQELARQQRMLAGDATTGVEAAHAEATFEKQRIEEQSQEASLHRLEADLERARLRLGFTTIVAPVGGDVVAIAVQEGQAVNAAQQTPTTVTLARLDRVVIRARIPESDIHEVVPGMEADITALGVEGRVFRGKVDLVQPVPERNGGAVEYLALINVDNPDRALRMDMTVRVSLLVGRSARALVVPIDALGNRESENVYSVLVERPAGAPEHRSVRVGISDAGRVEVLGGLRAGERVLPAPVATAPFAAAPR